MHGRKDRKTYSLFFASNSPKGYEKMKEAMWSVDKIAGNKFSDADPNPVTLFETFGYQPLRAELFKKYAGQVVLMADLEKFVIEETDYLTKHARAILKEMEASQEIAVQAVPGYKRPPKTFKSDKVRIIFST